MFVDITSVQFEQYDAIIVGSGFAGFTVARQLRAHGKRALIVETGRTGFDDSTQELYAATGGRGHFNGAHWSVHWVRALGGTSAVWGGYCGPLTDRNLVDWPLNREDLDPYYKIAAKILGRNSSTLNHAVPALPGFDYRPLSIAEPTRLADDTDAYLTESGADVLMRTTVSALVPAENRNLVTGLRLMPSNGDIRDITLRPGQALVLAAGGIGNPQILLNSHETGGVGVGNERDQVGRHLMEHPTFYNCGRVVAPGGFALPKPPEAFGWALPVLAPDDALFSTLGGPDLGIEFSARDPNENDEVEVFLRERIGDGAQTFSLNVRAEMAADPENRLVLDQSRDPAGLQRLRALCVVDAAAFRAVDTCLSALGTALAQTGPGRLKISNERIYTDVEGGGHIMGTTRMSSDPSSGVVDADCRVHGYANLYVAGSSVFASGGYVNPTLTLVALAARLGDTLAGRA